jgi:phosphate acyltransferase
MGYKIGIDVSGGDKAPSEIVKGALAAAEVIDAEVVLIGIKSEIEEELTSCGRLPSGFNIIEAPEKIDMAEAPVTAIRKKKNSSIVIGTKSLKEGAIDAFVSCGNTGAVACAATLLLGLIEGVERPGIALAIPAKEGISLVIDVGANIDCKPLHLLQYAVMASVYSNLVLNKDNPSVSLLNIGEEASKGGGMMKKMHALLSASTLNFRGNLEARDITKGNCDCIVCDGFVGNIALKVLEGGAEFFAKKILESLKKGVLGKISILLAKRNLIEVKHALDYAEYGGAPLLGVDGVVIIGHGRSNSRAVENAIKVAASELKRDVTAEIKRKINIICQKPEIKEILAV